MNKTKINTSKALIWSTITLLILLPTFIFVSNIYQKFRLEICGENMTAIGGEILNYGHCFEGKYPEPNKWCDLLINDQYVSKKDFHCVGSSHKGNTGYSNFAINPNCEQNSPPDTVLLFETKSGWNQHGGPELLTFDNHNGKAHVLLHYDSHAKLIKPEDVNKLKWKAEANEMNQPASR